MQLQRTCPINNLSAITNVMLCPIHLPCVLPCPPICHATHPAQRHPIHPASQPICPCIPCPHALHDCSLRALRGRCHYSKDSDGGRYPRCTFTQTRLVLTITWPGQVPPGWGAPPTHAYHNPAKMDALRPGRPPTPTCRTRHGWNTRGPREVPTEGRTRVGRGRAGWAVTPRSCVLAGGRAGP